jgi:hypothetical protein
VLVAYFTESLAASATVSFKIRLEATKPTCHCERSEAISHNSSTMQRDCNRSILSYIALFIINIKLQKDGKIMSHI